MPNGISAVSVAGQIKPFEQADNGHYFSRTHLATRFDEDNCHAECRYCNLTSKRTIWRTIGKSDTSKIGQQRFDLLKMKAAGTFKMTDLSTNN